MTGLTQQGLDLLENYVNRTSDVQTAALLASHIVPRIFRYLSRLRTLHYNRC